MARANKGDVPAWFRDDYDPDADQAGAVEDYEPAAETAAAAAPAAAKKKKTKKKKKPSAAELKRLERQGKKAPSPGRTANGSPAGGNGAVAPPPAPAAEVAPPGEEREEEEEAAAAPVPAVAAGGEGAPAAEPAAGEGPAAEEEQAPRKFTEVYGQVGGTSGIKLDNIYKTFKNNTLLNGVSWEVKKGERVGLVGYNGAGKTTQLKIITGELEADSGEIARAKKGMKVACLTQEFEVVESRTVREEFQSAFGEAMAVTGKLEKLQAELETCTEDMEWMAAILDEMEKLNRKMEDLDVEKIDSMIDRMMPNLGFKEEDNDRLVASYSGGWKMRMSLGKILLQDPDILLLDEPTNHIDIETIQWLEDHLRKESIPMVVVSHDREFLDNVCTKIVETERGVATTYKGNYTQYMAKKSENIMAQKIAHDKQQKEIARQTDIIHRLSGGGQSGRAEAAKKALAKIKEEGSYIEKPFEFKQRAFTFPAMERCGQTVAKIEHLTHGYNNKRLFDDVSLSISRGERIALIGPNGAGKSTLLRLVLGTEEPLQGTARLGDHNVVPNYFVQNQAEELDLELSALETLKRAAPDAKLDEVKALLGRMLFSGAGMERQVKFLSGGEKARLALAKFMLTPATLLVLDEPTNHLDIPSKEVLEEAIKQFDGAVIAVSHDRYFLRQIASRIVEVDACQLKDYKGDYNVFLEENEEEAEIDAKKQKERRQIEQKQIKAKSKMSKAEKARLKKEKAKAFNAGGKKGANKNAGRWK